MLIPEADSCRVAFESGHLPIELYHIRRVFIAVDCRIFIRGKWAALYELLSIRTDATVIWLTKPETGLMFPPERQADRVVHQLLNIRSMRKMLLDALNERQDKNDFPPRRSLTRTEKKVLPYFLAGISIATISRVTGIAEKTLHCHRRHILVKSGFRTWSYFQHIHQRNSSLLGISPSLHTII